MNNRKDAPEEILAQLASVRNNPNPYTFCPKCGKPFIKRPLNYLNIVVPSCPDRHGFWINEINAAKIVNFFSPGGRGPRTSANRRMGGIAVWFFIIVSFVVLRFLEDYNKRHPADYKNSYSMPHSQNVGVHYWPTRDYSQWNAFPHEQAVITHPEELEYFYQWIDVLNDGIINRLNMHDALLPKRPAQEYIDVFYHYAYRQNAVIGRLRQMYPPNDLLVFHNLVIEAAANQIDFYDDYARQKFANPSLKMTDLTDHPKLKACDQKLWAAYHEFQRVYPNRDAATNNAIEQRLCWMDMI